MSHQCPLQPLYLPPSTFLERFPHRPQVQDDPKRPHPKCYQPFPIPPPQPRLCLPHPLHPASLVTSSSGSRLNSPLLLCPVWPPALEHQSIRLALPDPKSPPNLFLSWLSPPPIPTMSSCTPLLSPPCLPPHLITVCHPHLRPMGSCTQARMQAATKISVR